MSRSTLADGIRQLRSKLAQQCRTDESDEQLLHAFTSRRDDGAFAVLVRRHGPMVLHVCRRVLGHEHDAEDAFQATFLVLARNAAALRNKTMLASFLHGTAYRTAMKAKQSAARRRRYEGQTPSRPPADPADELSWREVRALIDEEIARLPEIYRSAFVLCVLENVSREEAARRLKVNAGTISSRVAEARKRLAQRLSRRGVELTAVLAAMALATQQASALSAGLVATTIKAAWAMTTGEKWASLVSASVARLVHSMTAATMVGKAKTATLLLLTASLLAGAGAWTCRILATPQPGPGVSTPSAGSKSVTPRPDKDCDARVSGRVLDPDGKPVRGAKILLLHDSIQNIPKKVWATSAEDGRFAFMVPRGVVGSRYWDRPWERTQVLGTAEGYGFAVARLGQPGASDVTLRLVKDDVPIRGRILDLQGKPVAGVRVGIYGSIYTPEIGDLTAWLTNLKDEKRDPNEVWYSSLTTLSSPAFDVLFPPVTTGADGRFGIKGIGRERVVDLRIEGPTIATQVIHVMTRRSKTIRISNDTDQPKKQKKQTASYYGADFDLAAAPTRPIVGIVRDKDTGKPLPGITIETETIAHRFGVGFIRTTTDKDGRYRLVGLPKGNGSRIAAKTDDLPYLAAVKTVEDPLGLDPITVDFSLKGGVWVEGRVTEQETGKPLFARVEYFCFWENPHAKEVAYLFYYLTQQTEANGRYRIAALPGRGLIVVRARDHYIMGVGAERIKGGRLEESPGFLYTSPYYCVPTNYHALAEISPKSGDKSIVCDVALIRGRSLKGTVLDPDGKPLDGVRIAGLKDMGYWLNSDAEFTVESLQPNKRRVLRFVHERKQLAGYVVLRGDEKTPLKVRLQWWGTLTGRLVTSGGEPLAGARVSCAGISVHTGKDGRFRIDGLAAGEKYDLFISKEGRVRHIIGGDPKDLTIEAGGTKDLGDLRVQPLD